MTKNGIKELLSRAGIHATRAGYGQSLTRDLAARLPQDPWVIDVGANDGGFALRLLRIRPNARITSIEPNPEAAARYRAAVGSRTGVELIEAAVTNTPGPVRLNITEWDVGSSILTPVGSPGEPWRNAVRHIEVQGRTLDEIVRDRGGATKRIDLVKSDTQGFDLEVLTSLGTELHPGRVGGVLVECNIDDLYEGQANFEDLLRELRVRNFAVAGFYDQAHDTQGRLRWADVLFLPSGRAVPSTK